MRGRDVVRAPANDHVFRSTRPRARCSAIVEVEDARTLRLLVVRLRRLADEEFALGVVGKGRSGFEEVG